MLLSELAPLVNAQQGTVYQKETAGEESAKPALLLLAGYAQRENQPKRIDAGTGLVGQCALEKQRILLTKVPENYTRVHSSLGAAQPANIVVLPVLFEGETRAVIELASLEPFTPTHLSFLEQLTQSIGVVLNTIEATMRTENLLQHRSNSRLNCRPGKPNYSRPIRSLPRRPSSWLSRTPKSKERIKKSNRPARRWKKRLPNSRSLQSTNRSS